MTTIGEVINVPKKVNAPCNTYELEWKISTFSSFLNESDKYYYYSPTFPFVNERWCLKIYPNGRTEKKSSGCISLYLMKMFFGTSTSLEYTLGLKTFDGKRDSEFHRAHTFSDTSWGYGVHGCVTLFELDERKFNLMRDDVLTIFCNFKYPNAAESSYEKCTTFQKKKILEDFKQMFLKKKNCDVVLTIKGQEFPAHKSILAARLVLEAMFRNNMREKKTNNVDIEDCDPSSFSVFLCFLYCEDAESISQENVFNLYAAADKCDVSDLRSKCVDFIKENLSVDIFCETITLALKYTESELINLANDFFIKNAEEIVITANWQTFNVENPIQGNECFIKFIKSVKA